MSTVLYFFLAIGYFCLFIWGLFLSRKNGFVDLTNVLLLVIIGLIYDNSIIGFGRFMGEGNSLEKLSYLRFWLHALFTPTLVLFAWSICVRVGLPWAKKIFWKVLAILLTFGLILYELLTSVKGLVLEPKWRNDVLTYERAVHSENPVMVILVTLVILIVSIIFIRRLHFPWLFIGTILMIAGGLLTIWTKNFAMMNVFEFVFIVSLLLTKHFHVKYQNNLSPTP
ncbi:hypothetical protein [Neobacillus sp. LXY-1]|uniref:hypothetical protein n=1 Tax=Neobacillus sp. LXY-1 TaxID=3379133 RepID=UPI003EDF4960